MSAPRHETKALLISIIGKQAAHTLMSTKAICGCSLAIPKSQIGLGQKTAEFLNETIGTEAANKLMFHLGGEKIYIPRDREGEITHRNRQIVQAYNQGQSVKDIAYQFAMSDRWVWQILKETDMSKAH